MTWLAWKVRTMFCKHEWECEERDFVSIRGSGGRREGPRVSATCAKCGWHRSYWKW